MLREVAEMTIDYLREGGYLTGELEEFIKKNIDNEESERKLYEVFGADGLKELVGYAICQTIETSDQNDAEGCLIVFQKELPGGGYTYKDLLLSANGDRFMSNDY